MNIQAQLHRAHLPTGTTLSTFKAELAEEAARFTKNPEASAARFAGETVEISSLQSEGNQKSELSDVDQTGKSFEELMALSEVLAQDKSFIHGFTTDRKPDAEAIAVLSDVTAQVAKLSGADPSAMLFAPVSLTNRDQMSAWVGVQDGATISSIYEIGFHQTPGLDGGLMLARPLEPQELEGGSAQRMLNRPSLRLSHPEDGWQFAGHSK